MQYLFHKKRTYFPILSLSVLFLLLLSGCGRQQEYTQSGFYFDTVISLSVYDKDADHAKEVLDGALQLCETYDDLLNESKEDSDVYRINHAQGDYTSVSSETVSLLYTALQYCAVSDGHHDRTRQSTLVLRSRLREFLCARFLHDRTGTYPCRLSYSGDRWQ